MFSACQRLVTNFNHFGYKVDIEISPNLPYNQGNKFKEVFKMTEKENKKRKITRMVGVDNGFCADECGKIKKLEALLAIEKFIEGLDVDICAEYTTYTNGYGDDYSPKRIAQGREWYEEQTQKLLDAIDAGTAHLPENRKISIIAQLWTGKDSRTGERPLEEFLPEEEGV